MNLPNECIEQIDALSEAYIELSPDVANVSCSWKVLDHAFKSGAEKSLTTPSIYESAGLVKKDSQQSQQGGWISVEDRLPELTPKKEYQAVMCGYYTDNGKGIFVQFIGFYANKHKVSFGDDDYDGEFDEIEEQHGTLYLKEGWYENVEQVCSQYDYYYVSRTVTHWQPLLTPPNSQPIPQKDKL